MTFQVKVSKIIDVISNFHRLERPSCLGSAPHQACFLEFPFLVKRKATCLLLKKLLDEYDVFRHNTTFSDKSDIVRRIRRRPTNPTSFFVKEKKSLKLLQFCFGNSGVPICKKSGNFFFNMKIHHELKWISMQSICLFSSPFPEFQFVFYWSL